ncbi:MAG: hypothetical protein WCD79_02500 [Chthoniobacteraceae bacterium]
MPAIPKKLLPLLLSLALLTAHASADDQNPYDIVGKVLLPFAKIFIPAARTQNHALTAVLTLDEATGLPADAAGQTLEVEVQSPDKLRLHTILVGQPITICRNGDDVWAFPGSKIDALISTQTLPPENPNFKLPLFRLPLTEKQLVFLPILFQVQDAGSADVAGEPCRVLDLVLMPELARALKAQDWTARLWVGPNYHLAKVELVRKEWHAIVSIKKLEYAPSLPDETWQPSADEAPDVLKLTPSRYGQLLEAATRGLTKLKSSPQ